MRSLGMVLLTGAAAVVIWKILAVLFFGLMGMALKVALVILLVWFVLKIVQGRTKDD